MIPCICPVYLMAFIYNKFSRIFMYIDYMQLCVSVLRSVLVSNKMLRVKNLQKTLLNDSSVSFFVFVVGESLFFSIWWRLDWKLIVNFPSLLMAVWSVTPYEIFPFKPDLFLSLSSFSFHEDYKIYHQHTKGCVESRRHRFTKFRRDFT